MAQMVFFILRTRQRSLSNNTFFLLLFEDVVHTYNSNYTGKIKQSERSVTNARGTGSLSGTGIAQDRLEVDNAKL